jgi:hypothetical protein
VGITQDELPKVFDRFRQTDGGTSRQFEGSGIGLALVKEIVRLHGGTVSAQSEYGQGSRFTVTIPLGKDHLSPAAVTENARPDQKEHPPPAYPVVPAYVPATMTGPPRGSIVPRSGTSPSVRAREKPCEQVSATA